MPIQNVNITHTAIRSTKYMMRYLDYCCWFQYSHLRLEKVTLFRSGTVNFFRHESLSYCSPGAI